MTNNELFYFLGHCLALGENQQIRQEVVATIEQEQVNWNHLVRLASNHLVLPALYLRFKRHGILHLLPAELAEHLRMVYELNLQRNTKIRAQIDTINRLFATAGIVPVYLKGAANILDDLYIDLGERMLGDIDLLVSDEEFLTAANILKAEGYEHNYPFFEEELANTKHFPRLVHPVELADVEIHRSPVELKLSEHFNYAIIATERKKIESDPPCFVLSDRHKVTLNFMHGFMNSEVKMFQSITFRNLIDLLHLSHRVDIYRIISELPQYASPARIYTDFMYYSMGINSPKALAPESKRFIRKYNFQRKSKLLYRINWISKYLWLRIWNGYICNAAGIFYSKQIRRHVFSSLANRHWYGQHLKSYADSFRQISGRK